MNIKTTKTIDAALALLDPKLAALVVAAMEEMLEIALLHDVPKAIRAHLDAQPAQMHIGITAAHIWEIYGLPLSVRGPAMLGRRLIEQNARCGEVKVGDKWVPIFDPQLVIQAMKEGGLLEYFKKPARKRNARAKSNKVVQLRPARYTQH